MATVVLGNQGKDFSDTSFHMGYYTSKSANILALSAYDGFDFITRGAFTFVNGTTYGTITEHEAYLPGHILSYRISDISYDFSTHNGFLATRDSAGEQEYILSGNDTFEGGTGNDVLIETAGSDILHGGLGIDTLKLDDLKSAYSISDLSLTSAQISKTDVASASQMTIDGIERLRFSDGNALALDLGSNESAGQTALLIGAVLPGTLAFDVSKQLLLGTVIGLFDSGYSMRDLAGALLRLNSGANDIWSILAGGADTEHIAEYILTNITGHAPDQATLNEAMLALSAETTETQGSWLAAQALSAASQNHIDLVGLQQTGLAYQ